MPDKLTPSFEHPFNEELVKEVETLFAMMPGGTDKHTKILDAIRYGYYDGQIIDYEKADWEDPVPGEALEHKQSPREWLSQYMDQLQNQLDQHGDSDQRTLTKLIDQIKKILSLMKK